MDLQHTTRKKNRRILVQIRKISKTKIFVFFLCLLISFGVWVSMTFSQLRSDTLEFNICFKNHPENFTLINQPQHTLHLTIQASGYELQEMNEKKDQTLEFDVSSISLQHSGNQYIGVLHANDLVGDIFSQLQLEGSVKQMVPDSIELIYEKNSVKEVDVDLDIDYQLLPQHWICSDPVVSPKTIAVHGLAGDLDSLQSIKTIYKNFDVLSDTLKATLLLVKPDTKHPIFLSSDSIELMIPIEQFTEKTFTIPVYASMSNKNYKLKTFPNKVDVSCLVSLNNFDSIADSMFEAQVIYNASTDKEKSMLPVQIVNKTTCARISKVTPEKVEYILIKQ